MPNPRRVSAGDQCSGRTAASRALEVSVAASVSVAHRMEEDEPMDAATWTGYKRRIANVEEASQLERIIAELRERGDGDRADPDPDLLIGMARAEGHLSFGWPV